MNQVTKSGFRIKQFYTFTPSQRLTNMHFKKYSFEINTFQITNVQEFPI